MKINVFGLGYVGSVTAACLAHSGHDVFGIDVDITKANLVAAGRPPVIEAGLGDMMEQVAREGRLQVSSDAQAAVAHSDISMICVGTPSNRNGSLDLSHVENVCSEIGLGLANKDEYHIVVIRSTVLPGSTEDRLIPSLEKHSGKRAGRDFGVCINPEFMREGSGISDFFHPGSVVIGEIDSRSGETLSSVYENIQSSKIRTSIRVAEMVKYASNAFHAVKVGFANEIGILAKAHGIDGREVMEAVCADDRLNISSAYLRPGFAFGGSCLPKDLRALLYRAKERDLECLLLEATMAGNRLHVERGLELVENAGHKKVGVIGLSFKSGTDDMRESPVVNLVEMLIGKGYEVGIYDDDVELGSLIGTNKAFLEQEIPHITSLMRSSLQELLESVEVVLVAQWSAEGRQVIDLIRSDHTVIDLVGIVHHEEEIRGTYDGICW